MSISLATLIAEYQTDPDSSYQRLRFHVRKNHDSLLRRIIDRHGTALISDIKARDLKAWHREWCGDGKLAMAHSFVGQLRTILTHGALFLEDPECTRVRAALGMMRFSAPSARTERLTSGQADAIRVMAHEFGWHSIALAQAFQFELMLRQKDVIGEWVPEGEPGESDVHFRGQKWLRGVRWEEVNADLILLHTTSKRQKEIEVDLRMAPMIMEEITCMGGRKATGPIIICDTNGVPYSAAEFRRKWRLVATAAGIPKAVRSMDSRAGGITEASDAGADLEHIRHAATHSDIAMTQKYSRGATDKIAGVMLKRVEHRNRTVQ